ncbi:calmodulin-binding protein 60 A-like isoform X1 [Solanum lycopersicum]|uniref:calmodulin-binding protein 60 A-like isoform X1 n=1 Tax=Solanum lycopersicum TaxID=4081 RepID=UPI0002767FE1|nr:calmodulin-binding protein 60 A-like isoform X1 [Solanum lycopersicum]
MAVDMFEEGNSTSHTETTNSNTPPFTRLLQILVAFLLALWSASPIQVEDESHSELEEILTDQNRINSQKKLDPCESRCLCLKFSHEIVAPLVFTGECIFPNGTKLELVDAATGQQVRHGPLASSAQIEICVLNDENWTIEELNSHIMVQTRGCDQNPYLRLEGGVVSVNEIKFKHTPKHMKKLDVVKLGARVVDETEVIEAVTGPFTVKDQRLKSKKRYPPSPTDHVWSLEHICKYGAFHKRLTESGIKTVEDFLIELQNNPQRLRHILGRSMSENYWKKVTKHAKTCNLDGRKYLYHHLETEQKFTVAFDVAGQVMWLDSGCGLLHFNMLPENQKAYAQKLVETAFANWENVEKSDNEISTIVSPPPRIGGMSSCHQGNLVTVDECQSLEFQNTSGTTETYRSAECSTSYAFVDRQSVSDEMSVAITSPGHSGFGPWGYQNSPNDIISAISESGDWEELMQYLSSDAIQFDDFLYRELGQTNNSVAETIATQFHQLQHGVAMDLLQNQFMVSENVHNEDSTNTNQQCPMNNVSIVPEASTCKDKYKKIWIKITSIVKWLALNRFVKLKKVRMTKKRKSISK